MNFSKSNFHSLDINMFFINNLQQTDDSQIEGEAEVQQFNQIPIIMQANIFESHHSNVNVRLFPCFALQVNKRIVLRYSGVADIAFQGFEELQKLSKQFLAENETQTLDPLDQIFYSQLKEMIDSPNINLYENISLPTFWKRNINSYLQLAFVSPIFQVQEVYADELVKFMIKFWAGFYLRNIKQSIQVFLIQLKSTIAWFGPIYKESGEKKGILKAYFCQLIKNHKISRNSSYQELFLFINQKIVQSLEYNLVLSTKMARKISHSVATKVLQDNRETPLVRIQNFYYIKERQKQNKLRSKMIQATERINEDLPFAKIMQLFYTDIFSFIMDNFEEPINFWVLGVIKCYSEKDSECKQNR